VKKGAGYVGDVTEYTVAGWSREQNMAWWGPFSLRALLRAPGAAGGEENGP
jgi:hypothetical protein